jgi:shikimate kinase
MHIFLTGFMGVGKTTIGLQLSEILGLDFYDIDQEITNQTGKSITELFEKNGEEYFRE